MQKINWRLEILQKLMLKVWWKYLLKILTKYLRLTWEYEFQNYVEGDNTREALNTELLDNIELGTDFIQYSKECSWWEWINGSRLLFFRLTAEMNKIARGGISVWWLPDKKNN